MLPDRHFTKVAATKSIVICRIEALLLEKMVSTVSSFALMNTCHFSLNLLHSCIGKFKFKQKIRETMVSKERRKKIACGFEH